MQRRNIKILIGFLFITLIVFLYSSHLYAFSAKDFSLRIPLIFESSKRVAGRPEEVLSNNRSNASNQFEVRPPSYIEQFGGFVFEESFNHIDYHFRRAIEGKESKVVICDIMCATGKVGFHLQEVFNKRIRFLIFADGSSSMLERISPNNLRVLSLSEFLAFKGLSIDVVVSRYGMNNVERNLYPDIIGEYLRILKEGGTLIIQDHFPTSQAEEDAINSLELYICEKDGRNDRPYIPNVDEFKKLLERQNCQIIERTEFIYEFSLKDRFKTKGIKDFNIREAIRILETKQGLKYRILYDDIIIQYPIITLSIKASAKPRQNLLSSPSPSTRHAL